MGLYDEAERAVGEAGEGDFDCGAGGMSVDEVARAKIPGKVARRENRVSSFIAISTLRF